MEGLKRPVGFSGAALASAWGATLLLVLGAALAGGQAGEPPASPSAATLRLAVVDLDEVLEQSEQWNDHQEQLRRMLDTMRRTLKKHDQQLRILRSEYENLPPGTSAIVEKRAQIQAALREFQQAKADFERRINAQSTESLGKMYNKINTLLEQYARENKIDLVLRKRDLSVSAVEPVEMNVVIATTDVLYVNERYDITDAIARELNAQYPGEIREK